jgi:3-hydroxymyristoyl/3-hydroxydecanoyl-(acyl carrier protein) dehydratase
MIRMWHSLNTVETLDSGEWCTEVQVPAESSWFLGHFPGDPILPGIAQLGMAFEAASRALGEGFRIAGFNRIKFKKIIRPGDCPNIIIQPKKGLPGQYAFRITVGGDVACSGTMTLEKCNDPAQSGGV